jgi:hypothetical protein
LVTATSVGAGYLITGDRTLRALGDYGGVRIFRPRQVLELLAAQIPWQRAWVAHDPGAHANCYSTLPCWNGGYRSKFAVCPAVAPSCTAAAIWWA